MVDITYDDNDTVIDGERIIYAVVKHGRVFVTGEYFEEVEAYNTKSEAEYETGSYNRKCEYDELDTSVWYAETKETTLDNHAYMIELGVY